MTIFYITFPKLHYVTLKRLLAKINYKITLFIGKYYVPLSVEYACVARQLGALEERPLAALHPVTIHVNFQPCLDCRVKREPEARWRPAH